MKDKVLVSERALIQRINRCLAHDEQRILTTRGEDPDIGRHYIVDVNRGILLWKRVGLKAWGRKLGLLAPWEALA